MQCIWRVPGLDNANLKPWEKVAIEEMLLGPELLEGSTKECLNQEERHEYQPYTSRGGAKLISLMQMVRFYHVRHD